MKIIGMPNNCGLSDLRCGDKFYILLVRNCLQFPVHITTRNAKTFFVRLKSIIAEPNATAYWGHKSYAVQYYCFIIWLNMAAFRQCQYGRHTYLLCRLYIITQLKFNPMKLWTNPNYAFCHCILKTHQF